MTYFVHVAHVAEHPGVVRVERAARLLARAAKRACSGVGLLLAALVATLLVVANQVIDTWSEGHLLAAWIVMWLVAFAAAAMLAAPARRAASRACGALTRWRADRRAAAADRKLW